MKAYADFNEYWHPCTDYDRKTEFFENVSYRIVERPNSKRAEISLAMAEEAERREYATIRTVAAPEAEKENASQPLRARKVNIHPYPVVFKPARVSHVAGGVTAAFAGVIMAGLLLTHMPQSVAVMNEGIAVVDEALDTVAAWAAPTQQVAILEGVPDYRPSTTLKAEWDFSRLEGK